MLFCFYLHRITAANHLMTLFYCLACCAGPRPCSCACRSHTGVPPHVHFLVRASGSMGWHVQKRPVCHKPAALFSISPTPTNESHRPLPARAGATTASCG